MVKKKVALIENHEIGVYTIRHDLVMELARNYDLTILTELDDSFKNADLEKMVKFIDVGRSVMNPFSAAKYNSKLYSALKQLKPDVCLTFTIRPAIYGNIATRRLKVPTISTITGTGPLFESNSLSYRLARWLYQRVLKKTKFVFFPNFDDLNAFVERGYITKGQARRVPGSGVNFEKYKPEPFTRGEDGKFVFLYISRLIKDKGVLEYVEAASILKKELPHAEFHIIGPLWLANKKSLTVTAEELKDWIDKGLIIYHDKQKDVRPYMANADAVVMPSYREGMSNVLLEAASMARPLIATDVTGCRDIVEDGVNGFLCKVRDGKDLAATMKKMMALPKEAREQMGKSGREKMIREFDKRIVVKSYLDAIDEVVSDKKKNAFTLSIDWEDFGQLLGRDRSGVLTPPLPHTIDRQTDIILEMLNDSGKKATFFILGMLAEHRPDLVKKIAAEGHEIGLHGHMHINMRLMNRQQAMDDISHVQKMVTDIIGGPVYGFRAPYFSIDETNLFVLEVLAELGMVYDSSIFPIKLKRYGIPDFSREDKLYQLPNGREIVELPLTVADLKGKTVPVAGGGHMRAIPGFVLKDVFRKLNDQQKNVMLYMHPYEFDTRRIDVSTNYPDGEFYSPAKTFLINLRWNLFRQSIRGKLRSLLNQYEFITCLKKAEYVKSHSHSPGVLGRSQ